MRVLQIPSHSTRLKIKKLFVHLRWFFCVLLTPTLTRVHLFHSDQIPIENSLCWVLTKYKYEKKIKIKPQFSILFLRCLHKKEFHVNVCKLSWYLLLFYPYLLFLLILSLPSGKTAKSTFLSILRLNWMFDIFIIYKKWKTYIREATLNASSVAAKLKLNFNSLLHKIFVSLDIFFFFTIT